MEKEEAKKIETAFIEGINKSLGINKFAEEIYKAFPAIPKDKLLSLTRSFLENLKLLEKIYKVPEELQEEYNLEDFKLDVNGVVLVPKGWTKEIPKGAVTGPLKLTFFGTIDQYVQIPVTDIIINGKRFYKSDMWDYGRFFLIEY